MSAMKRRRGKPNRGGGRFNRGGGGGGGRGGRGGGHHGQGGGGGGGRKGMDLDFDDLMDGPVLERRGGGGAGGAGGGGGAGLKPTGRPSAHGRGRGQMGAGRGDAYSPAASPGSAQARPGESKSKVRVQMQHLHMTSENQEMVRDMLKSIHGDEHNIPSDNEYDELDTRGDDHYWQTERPLFVDSAHAYALTNPQPLTTRSVLDSHCGATSSLYHQHPSEATDAGVNPAAMYKLQRCGFSRELCEEALLVCDGDVGLSLEYLLTELSMLSVIQDIFNGDAPEQKDIEQQREEEKLALQAIFEHRFEERIANKVWVLHLDLPELKDLLHFHKSETQGSGGKEKGWKQEVCKFYKKGSCRFGDKCRQLHVPVAESTAMTEQAEKLQGPLAENLFSVEFRFPEGNLYPLQAPLIAFSSVIDRIPPYTCLNISRFLMHSALEQAEMQSPAVYSLVSLLEDRDQLQILFDMPPPPLSGSSTSELDADSRAKAAEAKPSRPLSQPDQRRVSESNTSRSAGKEVTGGQNVSGGRKHSGAAERPHSGKRFHPKDTGHSEKEKSANVLKNNKKLKDEFKQKASVPSYQKRMSERKKLPAWDQQDEILANLQQNQVVVISGMTGCGKTTQVPQFIFDHYLQLKGANLCNIICTQPRRISAIAVAQRVADERAEKLGNSVGYQIRLESVQSAATRLLFCTTGIILRRLEGDPSLSGVTHIIVDEVHERSEDSDFLLMILRDLLPQRPDLKIILMSATLNANLFSAYFEYCPVVEIPGKTFPVEPYFLEDVVEMTRFVMEEKSPYARSEKKLEGGGGRRGGGGGGRGRKKGGPKSYQDAIEESLMGLSLDDWEEDDEPSTKKLDDCLTVKEMAARYPDYSKQTVRSLSLMDMEKINFDLILDLLKYIVSGNHEFPQGAILVFLPGFAEIQQLLDMMNSSAVFGRRNKDQYKVVPLHSTLSSDEQNAVFAKPREGVTKIVIATNIAETSITIDDIVFVVDAGRMKEKRYDSARSMESLDVVWVSRANAMQRRGRAGRVTSGICFHLFTSHRFDYHLRDQPVPEIQRVPLEQLMLRIRMLDIFESNDPRNVLLNVVEPPIMEAMDNAMKRLQDVGAIDEEENLTALGYILGSLPVDVRIGKLMVFGAIFRCLDSALTIAAALSFKSPFVSPFGKKTEADEKKREFNVGNSDYLTILNAYKQWMEVKNRRQEEWNFCQENFLSIKTLQMLASLKQQYVELLSDIGFTKEGLKLRRLQRTARENNSDGIVETTGSEANLNTKNWKLISAILVGALYPNVVQIMTPDKRYNQSTGGAVMKAPNSDDLRFVTKSDGNVFIHPSSVNFNVVHFESPYLVYHEKVKTSKVYIRDCTVVSVYSLLLFAGNHVSIDLDRGKLTLSVDDGWIRFMASSSQVAELVKELRVELDQLLEDKIENPNMDLCTCPRGSRIISTIVTLITTQ